MRFESFLNLSPHFTPDLYCGGGSGRVYCVPLFRAPRRVVEHACGRSLERFGNAKAKIVTAASIRRIHESPIRRTQGLRVALK